MTPFHHRRTTRETLLNIQTRKIPVEHNIQHNNISELKRFPYFTNKYE